MRRSLQTHRTFLLIALLGLAFETVRGTCVVVEGYVGEMIWTTNAGRMARLAWRVERPANLSASLNALVSRYLTGERSLLRKLQEALLARRIEAALDK
jgi:hypothetical protein